MARAISKCYREHHGRGEHCKVEVYLRRDQIHYFFAYPADYADTVIIYNDERGLERPLQKAAFEVIFAYNESTGTLVAVTHPRRPWCAIPHYRKEKCADVLRFVVKAAVKSLR